MKYIKYFFITVLLFVIILLQNFNTVFAIEKKESTKLKDGVYIIKSALNEKYVFDIKDASKENGANLQLWSNLQAYYQRFMVKSIGNETYSIYAIYDSKYLDVKGSSKTNGTNVAQWQYHGGTNQQWIIKDAGNGYYNIISKCNGLYIDIPRSQAKNGANVHMWAKNNSKNQLFKFEKIETEIKGEKTIDNGTYVIKSALNQNYVFDIQASSKSNGGNAELWSNFQTPNQRFTIKYLDNGTYSISAVHSNKCLDVKGSSKELGANVAQWQYGGTENQQWIIKDAGNGYYNIISKCNGLYIDIPRSQAKNGANVQLWSQNNSKNQLFKFEKVTIASSGEKTIDNGTYYIKCESSSKVLDVNRSSMEDKGNVGFWTSSSTSNQKFKVTYTGNGYYTFVAQHSGKSVKISDKANSVNVEQGYNNGYDSEQWIIQETEDGYYNIISKINGNYLTQSSSGNAEVGKNNNSTSQKFKFEKPVALKGTQTIKNGTYLIKSALNNNFIFDIPGSSKDDNVAAKLWTNGSTANQKFSVTYNGNGYYTIKAQHSGKALEVAGASKQLYTNVQQKTSNSSDEQQWVIKDAGNGYYNIISKCSELCIGTETAKNGVKLQTQNLSDSNSVKFKFVVPTPLKGIQTIQNGTYTIASALNRNLVLDIPHSSKEDGERLEIWTNGLTANQKFNVKYDGNGYYTITAQHSGKAIEVANGNKQLNAAVQQKALNSSEEQKWIIKNAGNGYYNIISKCSELCMDVINSKAVNGTKIQTNTCTNSDAQKFIIYDATVFDIQTGTYGISGLKVAGNSNGSDLRYYKFGSGPNVFFATFCVHGFEDSWKHDGIELVQIADKFFDKLKTNMDYDLAKKWTIYIFPEVNPDGRKFGWTNNGPGRTTLYSAAPNNKGVDLNRCWSSDWKKQTNDRNYTGTEPFQAYEARYLRDFLLSHKSKNGQTLLVDLHGWTQQLIGDATIRSYYKQQFPENVDTPTYGKGYLINWARNNLGSNNKVAKSALIELPSYIHSSQDVTKYNLANKYINATLAMLKGIN